MEIMCKKKRLCREYGEREDILLARLLFARRLMMQYGVPYSSIWSLAGFSSRRQMEKAWNSLF